MKFLSDKALIEHYELTSTLAFHSWRAGDWQAFDRLDTHLYALREQVYQARERVRARKVDADRLAARRHGRILQAALAQGRIALACAIATAKGF